MAKKVKTLKFVFFCIFVLNRKVVHFYRHFSYIKRFNQQSSPIQANYIQDSTG